MADDHAAESVEVHFGQTDDGKWVAATCSVPYFFFEVPSEKDAHTYAQEAIRLYFQNRDIIRPESSETGQVFQHPTLSHVTRELLYA